MADHARQQVIEAFAALLTGMTSVADADVVVNRIYSTAANAAIAVRQGTDGLGGIETIGFEQDREVRIIVDYAAKAGTGDATTAVEKLNAMEVEVLKKVIVTPPTLGGKVKYLEWESTTAVEISGDEEKPVAMMTGVFVAIYRIDARVPDVLLGF